MIIIAMTARIIMVIKSGGLMIKAPTSDVAIATKDTTGIVLRDFTGIFISGTTSKSCHPLRAASV